jgi:Tol biopolymer transport system component
VVVTRFDSRHVNQDLWLLDAARGTESRLTVNPAADVAAVISRDGSKVAFRSTRDGVPTIFVKDLAGMGEESVLAKLPSSSNSGLTDWSADGRYILYSTFDAKNGWDLGVIPTSGEAVPRVVIATAASERAGRFSPNSRWIVYDSTESGRRELWIEPFPTTGNRWQLNTNCGAGPQWSPDGKELFYTASDGTIMVSPFSGGAPPEAGPAKPLFPTPQRAGGNFKMSADGQRFLLNVPPDASDVTPITVIVNWRAMALR